MRVRYDLLRTSQSLLYRPDKPGDEQHRTCWCHRRIQNRGETLGVYRTADGGKARIAGVGTCGSVWTCPVCATKVAEERRRELQGALVAWTGQGGHAYLLTLTTPHGPADQLAELRERFGKALQTFRNGRTFKGVATRSGRVGAVHSSECTWGLNGWHPHTHDLWFAGAGLDQDKRAIRWLRGAWLRALIKAGLVKPDGTLRPLRDAWRHGLDLRGGQYAAEYIAKFGHDLQWGMSSEMTRPHAKVGLRRSAAAGEHFTAFQLLEWARGKDFAARALWREYSAVYTGRRMLVWSRGLKKLLGVDDRTDEELAESPMQAEERVGELTSDDYAVVMATRSLGELLEYAARWCIDPDKGQADLNDFMTGLRARLAAHPPRGRPDLRGPHGQVQTYPRLMGELCRSM